MSNPWDDALGGPGGPGVEALARMRAHWALVCAWQRSTNLTAIAGEAEAAWLHYRDSLAALPHLAGGPVVDVGSGAGFPGMVLAICRPAWPFTLLEPRQRRASFLRWAAAELGLSRVTVRVGRVEAPPPAPFAHVVTRAALAAPEAAGHLLAWAAPGGSLIRFRGEEGASWGGRLEPYTLHPAGSPPRRRCLEIVQRAASAA